MTIAEELAQARQDHERLASEESHGHDHVHVTPFWPMTIVFAALLFLTVLTALTAHYIDIPGTGNLLLALFIASLKAILVAAWFMHLRYDTKMNTVVVVSTMFAVVLFIGLTMLDLRSRAVTDRLDAGEIVPGGTREITRNAAEAGKQSADNPGASDGAAASGH